MRFDGFDSSNKTLSGRIENQCRVGKPGV